MLGRVIPEAAVELYLRTHLVRAQASHSDSGLTWFRTGAPHEELNGVLRVTPDRVDESLAAMAETPALWHSWPGEPRFAVDEILASRGLGFVEEEPLMLCDLRTPLPSAPGFPADGRIQVAEDREALGDWVRVWTGTNAPEPLTDALASTGLGPARPVYHLVVRVQDEPVACAAAVLHRDALAVEHVVTLPEQRGRGLGTAVTRAVMELGRARGCTTAVLTASPDGSGIYRRLGFEVQGRVRRYAG